MRLNEIKTLAEERDGGVLKRAGEIVAAEIGKLYKLKAPERNNSNGLIIVAADYADAYKGSMKSALVAAAEKATEKVKKDLGVEIIVNIDDPFEIGVVKKVKLKEGEVIQGNFKQHGKFLVSRQADSASEKLFWNGTNFLATKKNSLPMASDVADKLITKFKSLPGKFVKHPVTEGSLAEEALDTKKVEDLWKENTDSVKDYRTAATYLVRQIKDSKPVEYEAFEVIADKRKAFGKYSAADLAKVLQPIRAGQKPDAEGFTTYVDTDKVQAFQYQGDPIKVMLKDIGHRLNKGDYVIRTNDGNDFNYTVDSAPDFESTLTEI